MGEGEFNIMVMAACLYFLCIFAHPLVNAFFLEGLQDVRNHGALGLWCHWCHFSIFIISSCSFFLVNIAKHWLLFWFVFSSDAYKTIGIATNIEHFMISQWEKDLLYSLSISSSFSMKLTMNSSVIGGNLLRMKLYFNLLNILIQDDKE